VRGTYGHIGGEADMRRVYRDIRREVAAARSRPTLTGLYRRAGYFIVLASARSWREKFGREAPRLRSVAKDEFSRTVRQINRKAELIGTAGDYDEAWGHRAGSRVAGARRRAPGTSGKPAARA